MTLTSKHRKALPHAGGLSPGSGNRRIFELTEIPAYEHFSTRDNEHNFLLDGTGNSVSHPCPGARRIP